MQQSKRWLPVVLIISGSWMTACQQQSEQLPEHQFPQRESAFTGQHSGPTLQRIRLTQKAAEKYNLKMAPVGQEQVAGALRRVVPATAVIHDLRGDTWVYTNPESLLFVRTAVTVDQVDGDRAVLSDGPAAGTVVVTAGGDQLFRNEIDESRADNSSSEGGNAPPAAGTATMLDDGTIKVVHRATGVSGLTANVVIEYKPSDEDYQKILDLVGGLKPGETKPMPAVPEL